MVEAVQKKIERSVLDYIVVEHGSSGEMEVHVCAEDVGTTDHCLIWAESQQTRAKRHRRGRKMYKWRIDKLDMEEKRQEFQEEMAKSAVLFTELLERVGRVDTEMERNRAGAKIVEGWEQLVKNTASEVIGKKLILCKRAVQWWDEEVKEAIRVRGEAHARWMSNKSTVGWEEYTKARKEVIQMV